MKKWVKVGLSLMFGVALIVPTTSTTANAAKKSKKTTVISTTKVAKKAYHGSKGDIYTSATVSKRKYQMKNYKYTTWYAYKKSVIKKSGKKATVTYIKSGKKAGWIYAKNLKAGKAPINKAKRLSDLRSKYAKIVVSASNEFKYYYSYSDTEDYQSFGYSINHFGDYTPEDASLNDVNKNRQALLNTNKLFKGRFTKSQAAALATMAKSINKKATKANKDSMVTNIQTMADNLGSLVRDLD